MTSADDFRANAAAALARGDLPAAARTYAAFAAAFPADKTAAVEAGRGLIAAGDARAAAAVLESALTLAPRSLALLDSLALAYAAAQAPEKAAGVLERIAGVLADAATAAPHDAAAWTNLGHARARLGQWDAAAEAYLRAAKIAPGFAAHRAAGAALRRAGRLSAAAAQLTQAGRLRPDDAATLVDLAQAERGRGHLDLSEQVCRQVLAREPGNEAARAMLAAAARMGETAVAELLDQARAAEANKLNVVARELYESVLRREPAHVFALSRLLTLDGVEGRLEDAQARHARLVAALRRADLGQVHWPFLTTIAFQSTLYPLPRDLYKAVTGALDRRLVALTGAGKAAAAPVPGGRRVKLGYFSGLFRDHPVGHVMAELFAAHDRTKFDVHVFFNADPGPSDGGPYTDIIRNGAEHFHTLSGDPKAMAAGIAAQELDVLIFIDGYTEVDAFLAAAYRPAPVQVFWLGHPGGCDISAIDYMIADATVVPPGEEAFYEAKVVRLPGCYHCASPHPVATPGPRAEAGLPEDGFVFCAFNHTEKIDPAVFRSWMNILKRVEGSVLWLSRSSPEVIDNLRALAESQGVDGARLIFAARVSGKAKHLARHALADLFLDTFGFNAHSTALDALWAGLPVLTVEGTRFSSRFGATALRTLGVPELICKDAAAYEDMAVRLADDPGSLLDLHDRVMDAKTTSPLFKPDVFVRGLEAALERMVRG